jgi:hypothetical protein
MTMQLHMSNGQTLDEYIDSQIEQLITNNIRIEIKGSTTQYNEKDVILYFKDKPFAYESFQYR